MRVILSPSSFSGKTKSTPIPTEVELGLQVGVEFDKKFEELQQTGNNFKTEY